MGVEYDESFNYDRKFRNKKDLCQVMWGGVRWLTE